VVWWSFILMRNKTSLLTDVFAFDKFISYVVTTPKLDEMF